MKHSMKVKMKSLQRSTKITDIVVIHKLVIYRTNWLINLDIHSFLSSFVHSLILISSFCHSFIHSFFLLSIHLSFLRLSIHPSFLPSIHPPVHSFFLPSIHLSVVPSFVRSFLPFSVRSFLLSFVSFFLPTLFLHLFLPSFLPSFLSYWREIDLLYSGQGVGGSGVSGCSWCTVTQSTFPCRASWTRSFTLRQLILSSVYPVQPNYRSSVQSPASGLIVA